MAAGTPEEWLLELQRLAAQVSDDADVLLYSGTVRAPEDQKVVDLCLSRRRRKNVVLILSTYGGDPHAAYRIARCLQQSYEKFTVIVAGFCKSAGTLLLVGAHKLILEEHAELGPLDVQVRKSDELAERSSGLTPVQALTILQERAYQTFSDNFIRLKLDMLMTTKTAADIATNLATGLYGELFAQIDPMRLGEMDRAVNIAVKYGERLAKKSDNLKEDGLRRLVADYPAHEFIIDAQEAREIFKKVELPSEAERALADHIVLFCRKPLDAAPTPFFFYLNAEYKENTDGSQAEGGPAPDANDAKH
jgi:membrane-bound ClpP family serine protease